MLLIMSSPNQSFLKKNIIVIILIVINCILFILRISLILCGGNYELNIWNEININNDLKHKKISNTNIYFFANFYFF